MVEVPGDAYTVTCTRLTLDDGRRIFVRTKWFKSSFHVTALDLPHSWSCSVNKQDVEERATRWEMSGEEYLIQSRLHLEEDVSGSMYSLNPLRSGAMRLSWNTRVGMKYDEPKVVLILHKDNDTMALVSEFMDVLMDSTLILQKQLARRNNKAHQPGIQFLAPEKVRSSMSHQGLSREDVCGGLDGLDVKFEFRNSPVSYETDSRLSTPTHPSNLTAPEGGVSQTQAPGVERSSKPHNSETRNQGRHIYTEETVPVHGRDAPSSDRPNPVGNHGGVSVRHLKSMFSGFHGLSESKREQSQAEMKRPRAPEHRSDAGEVPMTDGHEYYLDRMGSSQLKRAFSVDVLDRPLDRGVQPKQKFAAPLHEQEIAWAKPCTTIRCTNVDYLCPTSRPSSSVDYKNLRKAPTCDTKVISLESSKLGMEGSGGSGWKATTSRNPSGHVESKSFGFVDAKRRDVASRGRERIITLSDSEEEDCHYDEKELLHRRIPCSVEGQSDEPVSGFTIHPFKEKVSPRFAGDSLIPTHKSKNMAGSSKDLTPNTLREKKDSVEPNAWKVKEELNRTRFEAQDGSGQIRSRKRKETGDADDVKTDVEGKVTKQNGSFSEEQIITLRGSIARNKKGLDAEVFKSTVKSAYVEVESERQSEQEPVHQTGDHSDEIRADTTKYESRSQRKQINHAGYHRSENPASTFNTETRSKKWDAWISEARSPVTSWEVPTENRGSCQLVDQQTETHVVNTSSPNDSKYLDTPFSKKKKIGRDFEYLDTSLSNSEHLQSPQDDLNISPPSEVNSFRKQSQEDLTGSVVEQPETSYTSETAKKKKKTLSEDGPLLAGKKMERWKPIQIVKDGDSNSVEELILEPGGNDDHKVVNERQESQKEKPEKGVEGRKGPSRRGRTPAVNTCNDGKIQSDKMCQNVSRSNSSKRPFSKGRAARSTERPNRSNSRDRSPSVAGPVVKFQPQVEVDQSCQTDVPDSDYYCFDDDRTEEQIQPNQVWALYDEFDQMPRTLILIKEVSTSGPFSVTANWLQLHTPSKKSERHESSQFSACCGSFEELKESTVVKALNCFSHKLEYTLKSNNNLEIYPRVGEIWALHQMGNSRQIRSEMDEWEERQEEKRKYRLVVILTECGEGQAPQIQVLRKRTGFRTLWEPGYDPGVLPVEGMKRFSHKVPYSDASSQELLPKVVCL